MLTARDLALAYDRLLTAVWRNDDEGAMRFFSWLEWFWSSPCPPETDGSPDAWSAPFGGERGMRWYERDGKILAYDGRKHGCYCVPVNAEPPPPLPHPPFGREVPMAPESPRRRE